MKRSARASRERPRAGHFECVKRSTSECFYGGQWYANGKMRSCDATHGALCSGGKGFGPCCDITVTPKTLTYLCNTPDMRSLTQETFEAARPYAVKECAKVGKGLSRYDRADISMWKKDFTGGRPDPNMCTLKFECSGCP